ncbi:MAG: BspA family leucine-rich repeat surface protein, partial [Bacteroidota bacterium]
MKKVFLFLFFFAALASVAVGQSANDWFVTRWIAPANGTINFPAIGSGYTIRYVPINHITGAPIGAMQTISPASSGQVISGLTAGWTYRIDAYGGTFNQFSFSNFSNNRLDIVRVEQWGTTVWSSFHSAFWYCTNLDVTATDIPNLSTCTDMSGMFVNCTKLVNGNGSISGWQTANVTNMNYMFQGATSFNQPLNWNTANVTIMPGMFQGATSFNQLLNWNTANVTNMANMFYGATSFNQPLTNFNTQNVTDMAYMFCRATAFNQPLTNFNTQNVISMRGMFYQATAFNGDVNSWGNKVKNVTTIENMFDGATSFNHSLEDWVLKAGVNTSDAFAGTSIDCHNFTVTLEGWAKNSEYAFFDDYEARESYFSPIFSISFPSQYGYKAKHLAEYLMAYKRISVYLNNQRYIPDCNGTEEATGYILEIDSRRNATGAATPTNRQININVVGTNFSAKYTEIGNPSNTGTVTGLNTGSAITLPSPGKYTIAVYAPDGGSITALSTTTAPLTNGYITNIAQWGTTKWQSLKDAFKGCSGLTRLSAFDAPNLSEITSLEAMFQNCTGLINVPNINKWNLSNVTSLKSMFAGTTAFNQSLQNLDVSHIADFSGMFSGATAFDRSLGYWNLSGITDGNTAMLNMFDNSGLSCLSYHATLSGWNIKPSTPNNIRLGAANINYSNAAAAIRTNLQTNKGWTFVGDQLSAGCGGADASGRYITVWDTRNSNSPLRIRPNIQATNVTIDWEEVGNPSNNGTTNSFYVDLPHAGVYRLKAAISNNTALIKAYYTNTEIKTLLYVEQWGNTPWKYLTEAFSGAINLQVLATDVPNFSQMDQFGSIEGMFEGCISLTSVPSITSWNLNYLGQYRKSLSRFFLNCKNFDQDLNAWDVSSIKDMSRIFEGCTSFNHPLNNWNVSNVTSMNRMFLGTPFNQDITGWDVSNVTNMGEMFASNTSFNQPIGLWGSKMANVTWAIGMFSGATSFNQDLGAWKLTNIYYFENVFTNSGMSCENYSASLIGWAAQPESWHAVRRGSYGSSKSLLKYNAAARAARNLLISKGWMDELEYYVPDCQDNFYETTWEVGHNINPNADTLTINAIGTNFTVLWEAIDSTQNPPAREVGMDAAANASPGHPYTLMQDQWSKARVPGKVKVKVLPGEGTLTGLNMRGVDPGKLVSIDHWGNNKWQRLDSAFIGCEHMELKATDVPDLSEVTGADGLKYMFWGCMAMTDLHNKIGTWDVSTIKNTAGMFGMASAFNRNIGSWNVSNVTDMSAMFSRASAFNQPIGGWNVSKVTNMSAMFSRASAFNQPIGGWDVSKVTDMRSMFDGAAAFNRPLNDWNVSNVTSMHTMFNTATAFNQPLDRWDVRKSTSMGAMFYGATAFDQPLDNWKPFASTMMGEMFGHSGMSCENYSSTLYGWAQNVDSLKPNVYMTLQHNMKYGRIGKYARELIANKKNWQFADDTFDFSCSVIGKVIPSDFVTEWDMSIPHTTGTATSLRTSLYGLHFVVEYININDPTDKGIDTNVMASDISPYTITGLNPTGKYRVIAYKNPNIAGSTFNTLVQASDLRRLRKVTQWGTNRWSTMRHAFLMCTNLDVTATDVPDLTNVTNMSLMFAMCDSLVYNSSIKDWDVSNVTDMQAMFQDDIKFNQPLSNWDTRNVTDMQHMFHGTHSFDQPLDNFRIDAITAMAYMLDDCGIGCENLSSTLDSWKTQAAALNKNSINLSPFGTTQYYNQTGQAAITALQARGWTITGGTYAADCLTPTSWFTTVWDLSKPTNRTNSPNTTIAFPGFGTNYRIDWEDVDDPTNPAKRGTVTVSSSSGSSNPYYLTVPSGTTKVRIKAHKASGYFVGLAHIPMAMDTNKIDNKRLISVEQWGTTKWGSHSLIFAFANCKNMDVTATDKPNLSQCASLNAMFWGCSSLVNANGSISNWNTVNITDMNAMFYGATLFNQPLNSWNTANVTNMVNMFAGATSFNQPLNNWNTANVTNMLSLFYRATSFNQDISGWNTENVTDMRSMFYDATSFNQPLDSWNTAKVTNMSFMFSGATSFNKPLNSWNTAKVTDMRFIFQGATSFNQPVNNWNTAEVTNMKGTFSIATSFNQPLNSWNTAKVTDMTLMFQATAAFNQRLDSFKINDITTMGNMFRGCGISCENLSTTLDSWATQATALGKNNINLDTIRTVPNMYNETGKAAINVLKNNHNWTIIGGRFAPDCVSPDYYVSMWDMSRPATTGTATNLVTNLWGSNFRVEWKNLDDGTTGSIASATATTAPLTITGLTAGKRYRVVAYADPSNPSSTFSKLATIKGGGYTTITDAQRLDSVTQWGTNRWTSLDSAFFLCSRMDVTATDVPDLRRVKDLSFMFGGCDSLVYNPTINTWRTDSITNMQYMFGEDKKFNQPLGSWNTERVTNMHGMFQGTHNFDQDIHNWNTGKVTDMSQMFIRAFKFNQPIGSWSTANVTNMAYMFAFATSFNKPLYWNVEKVTDMTSMFWGADAFDQDLSYWTLKNVTSAGNMFKADLNKGMSCGNYSETLQGWAINSLTKTGLNFLGQDNRQYNIIGKESRDILTKPIANGGKGWTISGDTYDKNCGIDYVWTGAVSTNIADNGNWQGGQHPGASPILGEFRATVAFDSLAVRDMHIPSLPYTPPGSTPNYIHFYSFGNLINNSNKKVVIEPNGHLHINKWVFGSSTPADVDKIVIKADNTNPNGSLILAGQPCDKPVYATVEMYSKAGREATAMTWTDNITSSPTKDSLFSVHYRWQYIGIPVAGEYANAFYGSYLRKYDETYNDPN